MTDYRRRAYNLVYKVQAQNLPLVDDWTFHVHPVTRAEILIGSTMSDLAGSLDRFMGVRIKGDPSIPEGEMVLRLEVSE